MPYTNPSEREEYPREKALTEQSVPAIPPGPARALLGLISLLPAGLIALAIFLRLLDPADETNLPGVMPLIGIYGLIGSNLAVFVFVALALKNPYLDTLQRLGWAAVIVTLAPVALPVFWYRHLLHPLRYGNRDLVGRRRPGVPRPSHA